MGRTIEKNIKTTPLLRWGLLFITMRNPCRRICKLDDKQTCVGCGRTWEQIREWSFYMDQQKEEILNRLNDFKSNLKSRFELK